MTPCSRSIDSSLGRLGTDRIDVVHIHDPDDHIDEAVAGAYRALVDLRDQGVIHAVSLGTNSVQTAATFLERCDLDCVLIAGRYTLLDQSAAPVIRQCAERGDRLPGRRRVQQRRPRPADRGRLVRLRARRPVRCSIGRVQIEQVCRRHDVTLRAAALSFVLAQPAVTVVIVGMAAPDEVDENLAAADAGVPDELWAELVAEGLLAAASTEGGTA